MTHPVLTALSSLGPGAHSARDVWWALCRGDLNAPILPSVGSVEAMLADAWTAGDVDGYPDGPWRLVERTSRQESLL